MFVIAVATLLEPQLVGAVDSELVAFLLSQDLEGPAKILQTQGFNGSDFLAATIESLVAELCCTPFAARKLLRARDLFLEVNA